MSFFPVRKTDVGLILTVITLMGAIWAGYAKPASWDQCVKDMAIVQPMVIQHETQIAVLTRSEEDHFKAIMAELQAINKKVGR